MSRTREQIEADYGEAIDLLSGFLVLSYLHVDHDEDPNLNYEKWHEQVHRVADILGLKESELCEETHRKCRRYQEAMSGISMVRVDS